MSQRLQIALDQLNGVRKYTTHILDTIPESDWFRQPTEGVTHIAWQVGHLALADWALLLVRMRGERPEDNAIISQEFRDAFTKGSKPDADASKYPSPKAIRSVVNGVREQAIKELSQLSDADLDQPVMKPHPLFTNKLGAMLWSANHEMVHTGQIALLRRLFGAEPIW